MVKKLSREFIKRLGRRGGDEISNSGGGGISPGAIEAALAGYAKEGWVNENYLSIEFFNRIFTIHGTDNNTDVDVEPNDLETTITSIEAMFGFFTEYYVSALGNGGDLGSTLYLSSLADVALTSPISDGQVLQYNLTTGKWTNATLNLGSLTLSGLSDVLLTTPSANQVLLYDGSSQKWVNSALKTINGQPIYGSGDISVGGGASGNYLPLTGGTLVGKLTVNVNINNWISEFLTGNTGVWLAHGSGYGAAIETTTTSTNYLLQIMYGQSRLGSGGSTALKVQADGKIGIGNGSPSERLHISGNVLIDNGTLKFNKGVGGFIGSDTQGIYVQSGNSNWIYVKPSSPIELHANTVCTGYLRGGDSNGIYIGASYSGDTSSGFDCIERGVNGDPLYIQYFNTGNLILCNSGKVGIGNARPSYKLHVSGDIYATGAVTALSDMRKKDECGMVGLTVEQIANAPAVQFTWKGDRAKEGLQVGTYAQYWQAVLPEVVMDKGGELSMQYGVTALVSAIITARKVVDHERRIAELERENERLRTEIEQLRLN